MPLDGLRAMAVLWVVLFHSALYQPSKYMDCVKNGYSFWIRPIGNGDLGVDIFFTISGFLIGYIMLKDLETCDGQLDIFDFYRSRFLRVWPAMVAMTPMLIFLEFSFDAVFT
jgi:peptidoglycan/LPS O-acetylase OafA/YrhL